MKRWVWILALALGCSRAVEPCSPNDVELAAIVAECSAHVADECRGIPADQPCPYEDECFRKVDERCSQP